MQLILSVLRKYNAIKHVYMVRKRALNNRWQCSDKLGNGDTDPYIGMSLNNNNATMRRWEIARSQKITLYSDESHHYHRQQYGQ
jgi:hypothetical protein